MCLQTDQIHTDMYFWGNGNTALALHLQKLRPQLIFYPMAVIPILFSERYQSHSPNSGVIVSVGLMTTLVSAATSVGMASLWLPAIHSSLTLPRH